MKYWKIKLKRFHQANIFKKKEEQNRRWGYYRGEEKDKRKIMWYNNCHVLKLFSLKINYSNDELICLIKVNKNK